MLTPLDDLPVHQTSEPLAHTATGDANHYDRYFFNGYDRDGEFFFAAAMGVYPNRQVIDAAFSVVHEGVQRSVFASGRVPLDRTRTEIGPIRVEVVEGLRTLRLVVNDPATGIAADLTFTARTPAVEEPRMRIQEGPILRTDYTRLTQWGSWRGSVNTGAVRLECDPARVLGARDRSWGVRPVGAPAPGAPAGMNQFFWLWAPLNFDDHSTHLALNDDASGRQWYASANRIPVLAGPDVPTFGGTGDVEHMRSAEYDIEWEPGTRWARRASITMTPWRGDPEVIRLEPILRFQMLGIGYFHPEWGHGHWHGDFATGAGEWKLSELDPLALQHIHIQALCRAEKNGQEGIGVLEQLVLGPHAPSGFTEMLDGAKG